MADLKITELTALTTPVSGDLLAIVDEPSGVAVTKKITVANLFTRVVADTENVIGLSVTQNDTTNNPKAVSIEDNGTGGALYIQQDGAGTALAVYQNATTNGYAAIIDNDSTNRESLVINHNAVTSTSSALLINYSGVRYGSQLLLNSIIATGYYGDLIYSNVAQTTALANVAFIQDHASSTIPVLKVINDGTGDAVVIDQNANANGLYIDKDCTVNDTRTWAAKVDSDNAGTGTALGCGIDMSSFSVDEPLLKVVADAITSLGTLSGQFAIDVAGTTYYVPYYTTGA